MLSLEYRNKNKEKARLFMEKLKNKLDLENNFLPLVPLSQERHKKSPLLGKNLKGELIDIIFIPNSIKKHNQFYYKIIIK
jgi:hypothetical protein